MYTSRFSYLNSDDGGAGDDKVQICAEKNERQ